MVRGLCSTYDGLGRITSVTTYRSETGEGDVIGYTYNEADKLSAITYPDGTKVSYEYDLNNNLIKVTDREGLETTYVYDAINRITEIHRPNGISTYNTYNANDRITVLENKCDDCDWVVSSYSYTYDERGFITGETAIESLAGYAYDDKHNGKHTDGKHDDLYPHGTKHAKHDKDATFAYQIVQTDRSFVYDDAGKLLSATETEDNYGTYIYTYEYDLMGNRTSMTRTASDGTVAEWHKYVYNDSNQLVAEELYNGKKTTSLSYTYDGDGNRITETGKIGTDKVEKTYTYTVENRLEAVYDGKELLMAAAYDGDGNRVFQFNYNLHTDEDWKGNSGNGNGSNKDNSGNGKGNSKKNNGNASNAETESSQNQSGILFPVEGEVSSTEEYLISLISSTGKQKNYELIEYVNDVNREYTEVLVEQNINGKTDTAYVYGVDRLSLDRFDGSTGYYLYDPRGSVAGITNEEGQIYQSYRYSVNGEITFGAPQYENEYTYNAESYNPNIQSQYLRARYYNVVSASFLTEDSYLGELMEPLTLNRYNYCSSNPVNYCDPSGHRSIFKWFTDWLFGKDEKEIEKPVTLEDIAEPISTPKPVELIPQIGITDSNLYDTALPMAGVSLILDAPHDKNYYLDFAKQMVDEKKQNNLCENICDTFFNLAKQDPSLGLVKEYMLSSYTDDVITFLSELASFESSGRYDIRGGSNNAYLGKYQLGNIALVDIGFKEKTENGYVWTSTAKVYGVENDNDFLDSPIAQEVAMVYVIRKNYSYALRREQDKYLGTQIEWEDNKEGDTKVVTVTLSGLLAASHLVGNGELNKGLKGTKDWSEIVDGNKTPALRYMHQMGNLDIGVLLGGVK